MREEVFVSEQARARTMVARLELLSAGATRNYQADGRGGDGSSMPSGAFTDRGLEFEKYRARLSGCVSEGDFRAVADEAAVVLRKQLVSPLPPVDSEAWRVKVAYDTRGAGEVAADYCISRQSVWLIRKAHRKDAA